VTRTAPTSAATGRRLPPARALWVALFAVAFGTNVPTPLLLAYREQLDFTATTLTVLFAVYAVGLVPALLLAGPASDRRGRRRVVLPFVVLSAVASAVLMAASGSMAALYAGRLLQGVVSGVVFSVGSAWLAELVADPGVASRRAAGAMSLGFGGGPLVSGLLGEWGPAPLVVPYLVHLTLMAVALVVLPGVPETVAARAGRGRLINLGVPRPARPAFLAFVVPVALCVFTFPSVSVTILPLRLQEAMPGLDIAVTGLVAGVTLGVGVVVQPLEKRLGMTRAAPLAALAGAVGLGFGLVGAATGQPWFLLPAALLLGSGYGLSLAAGLTATQWLAAPEARGALVATFYALTYLGFAAPVILSATSDGTDFDAAVTVLAMASLAVVALLMVGAARRWVDERRRAVQADAARGPAHGQGIRT
jgi:MFS family permease